MRYHTKEYYTLMMAQGAASAYEPVIDKVYSDEEIEELYQKALDRYIEEERAAYDEPPVLILDEDLDPEDIEIYRIETEEYENREPFDEEEAAEEFEELYRDNLEEPDEDLPDWVREAADPRILAMYFMPEKLYRKLSEEDEVNEEKFDALDERADEALEEIMDSLPEEYVELMETLSDLEDTDVLEISIDGAIEMSVLGWDDEGEEKLFRLRFDDAEVIENEGLDVSSWVDEDGDTDSDCELIYSEVYMEDGRPEIHMMFDNNGLKYLTFRCSEAEVFDA